MIQKLLETVKIINGQGQHLVFHQTRMQRSYEQLGIGITAPDLKQALFAAPKNGEFRARIIYQQQIDSVEYFGIQARKFQCFKQVRADFLEYPHKFLNRDTLNALFAERGLADDVLLIKRGLVTDTSIANVAFLKNQRWFTPRYPLLPGTTRARLLQTGQLKLMDITPDMLPNFEKMALCNAILGFYVIEDFKIF